MTPALQFGFVPPDHFLEGFEPAMDDFVKALKALRDLNAQRVMPFGNLLDSADRVFV